ncbi:hypothetical protein [Demequina subtropica]|uniref:hypothetical protein n=1 Tax=Demequina subtropica TaxID=1638989 RepID=UPI000785FD19|nr:hypothetical protein [Demequina subtropica]
MRGAAALVAGIVGGAVMAAQVPWHLDDCASICAMASDPVTGRSVATLVIFLAIPAALLTAVLVWTLGIRPGSAHEAAVRAALGEAAHAGVRRAALIGLRDGAAVAAAAYAIAGSLHVSQETSHGWEPFSTFTDLWTTRAVEAVLLTLALTVAHALAVWRPQRSPAERLREDAEPLAPARFGRGARIAAGIGATAAGVVVGLALTTDQGGASAVVAAGVAYAVAWVAAIGLVLGAVLPWARTLAPRFVALAAGLSDGAGAPRLAAVLAARASSPTRAAGRAVMAVGAIAFALAAWLVVPTGVQQSDRLAMTLMVDADAPDLSEQIAELDGVERVVVGDVVSGVERTHTVVALDPSDLAGVDDDLARALRTHPDAVVSSATSLNDLQADAIDPDGIVPSVHSSESYVGAAGIDAPGLGTAYLVYVEAGAAREAIGMAVADLDTGEASWASSSFRYSDEPGTWQGVAPASVALVLLLAPLALGAVRAGGRDAAMLAALGVEARIVRQALAIEGAVVASVAVAAGAAAGVVTRMTMSGLGAARRSLGGILTDSYPALMLESVPWSHVVMWGVLIFAAFVSVTALAASAIHLGTPAEALRDSEAVR